MFVIVALDQLIERNGVNGVIGAPKYFLKYDYKSILETLISLNYVTAIKSEAILFFILATPVILWMLLLNSSRISQNNMGK